MSSTAIGSLTTALHMCYAMSGTRRPALVSCYAFAAPCPVLGCAMRYAMRPVLRPCPVLGFRMRYAMRPVLRIAMRYAACSTEAWVHLYQVNDADLVARVPRSRLMNYHHVRPPEPSCHPLELFTMPLNFSSRVPELPTPRTEVMYDCTTSVALH